MIAAILPSVSDQEDFFAAYQRRLKKSFSQVLHKQYILPDYRTIKPSPFTYLTAQYIDRVDTSIALGKTRQHQCGLIYIQEIAASIPASIARTFFSELYAQTHKPLRVLDVCAAP
jgi:16S rRNA C967 or C1407 C5-methylase (RsmB/RsmF family)